MKESFRGAHSEGYIRKNAGHIPAQGGGVVLVGAGPSAPTPLAPALIANQIYKKSDITQQHTDISNHKLQLAWSPWYFIVNTHRFMTTCLSFLLLKYVTASTSPFQSASSNCLIVPPVKLSTAGSRSFAVAAPHIWNGQPNGITPADSDIHVAA